MGTEGIRLFIFHSKGDTTHRHGSQYCRVHRDSFCCGFILVSGEQTVSYQKVRIGNLQEVPEYIKDNDLVLDVGGGDSPLSRANYVMDVRPWEQIKNLNPALKENWPNPHFSKDTWVCWDICSREAWPFKDKQFDFVVCKHTLEDVRDPIWVCNEIIRVGKSGYIETPSRIVESMLGVERSRYCGYSHHRWLCDVTEEGIKFLFKPAQLHVYPRFQVTPVGGGRRAERDHSWREAFDPLWHFGTILNRWFREVNPKYSAVGFFWFNSFQYGEQLRIEKAEVEADLMSFKERCLGLDDLWVWKRTWYGKKIPR